MHELEMLLKQQQHCSFHHWYPKFKKHSIRGILIEIPPDILEFLRDEIVILPKECYPSESDTTANQFESLDSSQDDDDDDNDNDDTVPQPEFPTFSNKLQTILSDLGVSGAFLKTQWHCPKDSFWITTGQTLKVKDITDIYQLLKASSIVKQDLFDYGLPESLTKSIKHLTDQYPVDFTRYIVLKEWLEIHPGTEFRCFVRDRNLIAISPRDWPSYHSYILQQKYDICSDIVSIFKEKIKKQFDLDSFVFDVIRIEKDNVLVLDFSPFHSLLTDSLAYDWTELLDRENFTEVDNPEFRYLPTDCGIQPSKRNNYGIPLDIAMMFLGENSLSSDSSSHVDIASLMIGRMQIAENEI